MYYQALTPSSYFHLLDIINFADKKIISQKFNEMRINYNYGHELPVILQYTVYVQLHITVLNYFPLYFKADTFCSISIL